MLLTEFDGKALLKQRGLSVPEGLLFDIDRAVEEIVQVEWSGPGYLKAQVLEGRRGARGLVRRCDRPEDVPSVVDDVRSVLGQTPCAGLLWESALPHGEEWLVSCDIDREEGLLRVNYSSSGGMRVATGKSVTIRSDASWGEVEVPVSVRDVLRVLHESASALDALSIEINPLAIREDGSCVALDAKIELDDAAWFRHPEWSEFLLTRLMSSGRSEREQAYANLLKEAGHRGTLGRYVELDGDVAVVLSGGGASLVSMDALMQVGLRPANYVEASGNPDPEGVQKAADIVFSRPGIRAVWIAGSFANFTDIQATVMAVLRALEGRGLRVPVVVRRDGPSADQAEQEAIEWARMYGIPLLFHRGNITLDQSAVLLKQSMDPIV